VKAPHTLHRPARAWRLIALLAVAIAIAPFLVYPIFLMKLLCFALFALAFNLLLSYGGLLSFGQATYFGLASYVTAFGAKNWGLTPEVAILAGTSASAALGWVFGAIAIRRQGIYFSMITLALAQMVYFVSVQWTAFTGGDDGIQDVPRGKLLGLVSLHDDATLYVFVALVFLAGFALVVRIVNSPFGQVLEAIRDNEPRAISLGYRVQRYKLMIFTLSATLSGLAGGLKAVVFQVASLTDVNWSTSGEVVLMTLVGGMGTLTGPIVGAAVMISIENYLAVMGGWITVLQGAIFVACVLAFREGIVGFVARLSPQKRLAGTALRADVGPPDN
jgi:branched-chain amino acid transport system permease protein